MTPRVLTRHEVAGEPDLLFGHRAAAVRLQSLDPGDAAAVLAVFDGMGPRSRELRFLTHKPRLSEGEVRALTRVDGRDHEAVLATSASDGAPVGIARFVRSHDDEGAAEIAVAVVDAWQRRGVGTMILAALARRAGELGVRRFHADVASDNRAVLRLLRRSRARWSLVHAGHGVSQVVVALDEVAA